MPLIQELHAQSASSGFGDPDEVVSWLLGDGVIPETFRGHDLDDLSIPVRVGLALNTIVVRSRSGAGALP